MLRPHSAGSGLPVDGPAATDGGFPSSAVTHGRGGMKMFTRVE